MAPGVYISWPFCSQKCTYCNFASGVQPKAVEEQYARALLQEMEGHRWDVDPDTVYLGGGTPSLMPIETLRGILDRIPGRPWKEATLETAPGTVTPESARAWRDAAINRISLGVQSFVTREAARTGRRHTPEMVADEIRILHSVGIENYNVDLIAGLPGQTEASWEDSLDWLERLQPPHVSVYMLEVDEDSRLGQEVLLNGKRYGAPDVPSDETIVRLYERAVERLDRMGVHRYEISNFARPGFESAHNLKYWRLEPYIGFGADAHSFDGALRWQNVESAAEYVERMRASGNARLDETIANRAEERFFVGLRLMDGIQPSNAEWERFAAPIDNFVSAGLLERSHDRLRLTSAGVLLSNEIFAEFIDAA